MDTTQTLAMLSAVSAELADVRTGIEDLAGLISSHVQSCPPAERPRALRDAQAVDVLTQRLDALRGFTQSLADEAPIDSALGAMPLADLATRMRARIMPGLSHTVAASEAGDLDLF